MVQNLQDTGHNSKDTGQRTRCTLVSESSRSYCSTTTVVQYLEETTQTHIILLVYKGGFAVSG